LTASEALLLLLLLVVEDSELGSSELLFEPPLALKELKFFLI
jgi:hypothetical protein